MTLSHDEPQVAAPTPVPPQVYQYKDIGFGFTSAYDQTWDDSGSGASQDGATWRPKTPTNIPAGLSAYPLGDLFVGSNDNPNGNTASLMVYEVPNARPSGENLPALAAPIDFTFNYNDQVFMLQAPDGYTALGGVAKWDQDNRPDLSQYRCVRTNLLTPAVVGNKIYDDSGTGRSDDLSVWGVQAQNVTIDQPQTLFLSPGTFMPSGSSDTPPALSGFYALQLTLASTLPAGQEPVPVPPTLTSFNPPPDIGEKLTYITYLPWFAVQDSLSEAQRIVSSPVYTLVRTDYYKKLLSQYNNTSLPQTPSYAVMDGVSQEKTKEFSHKVGVELGAEWSVIPKVLTVSAKLSYEFTYTSSTSDTMESQTTYTVPLTIPPKTNAAVFAVYSSYQLYRGDGTLASSAAPEYGRPNTTYSTQFPPATNDQDALVHGVAVLTEG